MLNVEELFSQIVLQVSLASRSTLSKIKWEILHGTYGLKKRMLIRTQYSNTKSWPFLKILEKKQAFMF